MTVSKRRNKNATLTARMDIEKDVHTLRLREAGWVWREHSKAHLDQLFQPSTWEIKVEKWIWNVNAVDLCPTTFQNGRSNLDKVYLSSKLRLCMLQITMSDLNITYLTLLMEK